MNYIIKLSLIWTLLVLVHKDVSALKSDMQGYLNINIKSNLDNVQKESMRRNTLIRRYSHSHKPMEKCTIPSPEIGLSNAKKLSIGSYEERYFRSMTDHINFKRHIHYYNDPNGKKQSYTIYEDEFDVNLIEKRSGVQQGIQILLDRKIHLPRNLEIYLTPKYSGIPCDRYPTCCDNKGRQIFEPKDNGAVEAKCINTFTIAFQRGKNFNPVARIIIDKIDPTEGALSSTKPRIPGYNQWLSKTTITIIHEIGHILHERYAGELFWDPSITSTTANSSFTKYGDKNVKEFVAEVFTALVLRMPNLSSYSPEYKRFRGPHPELFLY